MKVSRLGKDRYILAVNAPIHADQLEALQAYWKDWWDSGADPSKPMVFGGEEIEFVDFISAEERLDDIDEKLNRLLDMLS